MRGCVFLGDRLGDVLCWKTDEGMSYQGGCDGTS